MSPANKPWVDDRPWPRRVASRIKVGLIKRRKAAAERRIPPRHANPYSTHLPVLIGLAARSEIRNVLELGSGPFSTPLFLNRDAFPHVERLVSIENDAEWAEKMNAELPDDERLEFQYQDGTVPDIITPLAIGDFDLVLIDDSTSAPERSATIRHVIAHHSAKQSLVVHDFEMAEYQQAGEAMPRRFIFDALNPYTGLLWDGAGWNPRELKALKQTIRARSAEIDTTDLDQWIHILKP